MPCISLSMRLTRLASTLPGPHSSTCMRPRARNACTTSTQRTAPLACRYSASRMASGSATLSRVALDISGRPYLVWNLPFPTAKIGTFDTELVRGMRYFVPLMLLFWLWPLVELAPRLADARTVRAVMLVGVLLVGGWTATHTPEGRKMIEALNADPLGWYRENDKDHSQYKRTIAETLEQGYRTLKVKVGRDSLENDVERINVARQSANMDFTFGSADNGRYVYDVHFSCVRLNGSRRAVGGNAFFTVEIPVTQAPAFTGQPANVTVTEPAAATFSAAAAGSPTPTLQWQRSPDGSNWVNIPGATGNSYTLSPTSASADSGAHFRAVATNTAGSAASNVVDGSGNSVTDSNGNFVCSGGMRSLPVWTTQPDALCRQGEMMQQQQLQQQEAKNPFNQSGQQPPPPLGCLAPSKHGFPTLRAAPPHASHIPHCVTCGWTGSRLPTTGRT